VPQAFDPAARGVGKKGKNERYTSRDKFVFLHIHIYLRKTEMQVGVRKICFCDDNEGVILVFGYRAFVKSMSDPFVERR